MASRSTAGSTKSSARPKSPTSFDSVAQASKPDLEVVAEKSADEIVTNILKKQELVQLVADRSNLNNNKVKPVLEAMLEVLGEAIAEGRELNLQPFGRVKINRQKEVGNARVTIAKIRQPHPKDSSDAD